jgi:hypothetical protein
LVARASARAAARKASIQALLEATADPDGRGLLVRGREFQPVGRVDLDSRLVEVLVRLARLSESVAQTLRDHPDPAVRRSAAIVAARAHPIRAGFDA